MERLTAAIGARILGKAALLIAAAGVTSVLWWRAWMYWGWPGTPGFLPRLLGADGEAAYDAYGTEMFLVSLAVLSLVAIVVSRLRRAA